ncbi:hypothetical protein B0H17DRAFT_1159968 [Mycena rosella]|uniref:CxC2-like cysteine cluster KDZ transposase-associated domain-containing protein n=1 Tax=Mycena rosella TaxID=1033263 RepID=A0AAD7DI36_MYCRO|nr:hypothetical protein B0H17DRAFT_1159968 [Mycena rosella]
MGHSTIGSGSRPGRRNMDSSISYDLDPGDYTADRAIYPSTDGWRAAGESVNFTAKRRSIEPTELNDTFGNWIPVPDDGESLGDDPNGVWCELKQMFLNETVRCDGLGDSLGAVACGCCLEVAEGDVPPVPEELFKCNDCGDFLQCKACVISQHTVQPLHVLKKWTGEFWDDITIDELDVVYQVGHGGHRCRKPLEPARTMVVVHTNGIHTISFRYCGCDRSDHASNIQQLLRNSWYPASTIDPATCATFEVLELYRLLNVVGNINVHDFVRTLERQTNSTKVKPIPDRYKAFGRMTRQYAFLKRAKRAGRAHDILGLDATPLGGCTVLCWACPQDGKNLPAGWRDVALEFRFLYMLLLAVDASFRLKNRIRKNEVYNPSFGSGWGHLVEEKPYKKHLKNYVAEKDVSTCIAFAALLQKDTRMTTGLRCSGVGAWFARMGDLQKGERYANMDYIFLSSILGLSLMLLTVSYDIACQWQINLRSRMEKMPNKLKIDDELEIQFGLPVWHAAAHEINCQAKNSLNYLEGVGRTDGEGIERTWSDFNPLGWATKEMGNGPRHDALEDKIDHHNWEKNIAQGGKLARKLVVAIEECDIQIAAFTTVDDQRMEGRQDKPNPYQPARGKRSGPSEVTVRIELKKDEAKEAVDAEASVHSKGTTAFIVADQSNRVEELCLSFVQKLKTFQDLQARHMPEASQALEEEEEAQDPESAPINPENVTLWMPSELKGTARTRGCVKGLAEKEAKLREAQCSNALDDLQRRLHAKRHFIQFRNSNVVGQRQATQSNTLIAQVRERIETITAKYCRGWKALTALKGKTYCEKKRFFELKPEDIALDEEEEVDAKSRHRLGVIGSGSFRHKNAPSQKKRTKKKLFPWIWTARGGPGEDELELHEGEAPDMAHRRRSADRLLVAALARKVRWTEEVQLLQEEMRRVMHFLKWKANWWEMQREARGTQIPAVLRARLAAYAARQAHLHRQVAARFKTGWDTSVAGVDTSAWSAATGMQRGGLSH